MQNQRTIEAKVYRRRERRKRWLRYRNFLKARKAKLMSQKLARNAKSSQAKTHNIHISASFSTSQNVEEVLELIAKCKLLPKGNDRFVFDFGLLQNTNAAALALLLSLIHDLFSMGVKVHCIIGQNTYAKDQLTDFGFLAYFKDQQGNTHKGTNKILVKGRSKTNQKEVAQETQRAMQLVFGKSIYNQPLQGALIEMMANSINHAFKKKKSKTSFFLQEVTKQKRWYLSIAHNTSTKQVYFSFIDNGAGILETIRRSPFKAITDILDDKSVLENAFNGDYRSSTKLVERGHGLPTIKNALDKGAIRKLKVITNGSYYDFENQSVTKLTNEFEGTFYLWTLDAKCFYGQN